MHNTIHNRRSRTSIAILTILAILGGYFVMHLLISPSEPLLPDFWAGALSPSKPAAAASYHNYTSAFSFDLDLANNPNWMSKIPDAAPLSTLSIPGTHDTLTHNLTDNVVFQCQNHDLQTQLRAGWRYFDIRGRLLYNAASGSTEEQQTQMPPLIGIYHGHVATGYTLEDVLQTVFAFLDANPSEGVILRIKEEGAPLPIGDPGAEWVSGRYNVTFEEAFNYYRRTNPRTAPGCAKHLLTPWPPSTTTTTRRVIPTMGEMRGRVLVLYEFPTTKTAAGGAADYGIEWTSPHIALEDMWIILAPELLEEKWDAVRRNLEAAGRSEEGGDVLFLSHLSASVGVTPIEAAAGPSLDRTNGTVIIGLNERTGRWVEARGGARSGDGAEGKTGVIMADFPGKKLVGAILRRNKWLIERGGGV